MPRAENSERIRKRYDRLAPWYDGLEGFVEGLLFKRLRTRLWALVAGADILEIGVGTGKNFAFYPRNARITAIDFSAKMLAQAKRKSERKKIFVDLAQQDAESLCYADNSFDTVIASFVFCSVPAPHKGLKEAYRVLKPGGQLVLLEHVLSSRPLRARIMNLLNPMVVGMMGANINRETVKSVQACPFRSVSVEAGSGDIIKLIRAVK
jgi:phosphatidylethanolamine/phosphatidyl-N-methylethanolamine N-methyltransferase